MRIDLALWVPKVLNMPPTPSGSQIGSEPAAGDVAARDAAGLSLDSDAVHALADKVIALPEIRLARVGALERALRIGAYQVNPEETAEALLSQMQLRSAA